MVLKIQKKNTFFKKYVIILHYHCLSQKNKKTVVNLQCVLENFGAEILNSLQLYEEHT